MRRPNNPGVVFHAVLLNRPRCRSLYRQTGNAIGRRHPFASGLTSAAAVACCWLLVGGSSVDAEPVFSFTRIADTNTADPEGGGAITDVSRPFTSGGNVVFRGYGSDSIEAVFYHNGSSLSKLLKAGDAATGAPGFTITSFSGELSIEGSMFGMAAFIDNGGMSGKAAYLVDSSGALTPLAITGSTLNPTTGVPFVNLGSPGLFAGEVAFSAEDANGVRGVYTNVGGTLAKVVDTGDPVPGRPGMTFTGFDLNVDFDDNIGANARFTDGVDNYNMALLATPGGVLTNVADTLTTNPTTAQPFDEIEETAVSGGSVVFASEDEGVYTNLGGTLRVVADIDTQAPGVAQSFEEFQEDDLYISGDTIIFEAEYDVLGNSIQGLFMERDGDLTRLITEGDALDGRTVSSVSYGAFYGTDGDDFVFQANFTDGSRGVYFTSLAGVAVPELGAHLVWLLLGSVTGCFVAFVARRRRVDPKNHTAAG